jgi:N-acetylmuramoyl-L-alanine amidase
MATRPDPVPTGIEHRHPVMKQPAIHARPLAYEQNLQQRKTGAIDLVVVHCTELPDLEAARTLGERIRYPQSNSGNSGHFYIDRDGRAEQWVEIGRTAHHVRGFNERSIGIELVNRGRYPDWLHSDRQQMKEAYSDEQICSLINLLGWLCGTVASLRWIAGHENLDTECVAASNNPAQMVRRKLDPGPLFPWHRLMEKLPLQRLYPQFD